VFNQEKLPEIVYKSPVYCSAPCNNKFLQIWIFLATSVEKQVLEPLSAGLRIARSNFENEDAAKSDCFCDFKHFFKRGGANATSVL